MLQAKKQTGNNNNWLVFEEGEKDKDGKAEVIWRTTVAVKAGGTKDDAIALAEEIRNPTPPTPEEIAAEAASAHAARVKADCKRRILSVASEAAQMNIAQAGVIYAAAVVNGANPADALAAAGLQDGDLTLAQGWKAWVAAMQVECARAASGGDDPVWPDVPEGVADLAARF